jgi:hypothetical protein
MTLALASSHADAEYPVASPTFPGWEKIPVVPVVALPGRYMEPQYLEPKVWIYGKLVRIRNPEKMSIGSMWGSCFTLSEKFLWLRYGGLNQSIVDVFSGDHWLYQDALIDGAPFGCENHYAWKNVTAVRYGRLRDMVALYGISDDDRIISVHFEPRDVHLTFSIWVRDHHTPENEVMISYGRDLDLHTRFCFDPKSAKWSRSPGEGRGIPPDALKCALPL